MVRRATSAGPPACSDYPAPPSATASPKWASRPDYYVAWALLPAASRLISTRLSSSACSPAFSRIVRHRGGDLLHSHRNVWPKRGVNLRHVSRSVLTLQLQPLGEASSSIGNCFKSPSAQEDCSVDLAFDGGRVGRLNVPDGPVHGWLPRHPSSTAGANRDRPVQLNLSRRVGPIRYVGPKSPGDGLTCIRLNRMFNLTSSHFPLPILNSELRTPN